MKTHIKIALFSIGLGLILVLGGILLGADLNFNKIQAGITSETKVGNFSEINAININLSAYSVEISPSDNNDTTVEYPETRRNGKLSSKLNLKVDNETLHINEDVLEKVNIRFKFPFGESLFKDNTVKIKIPKEIAAKINLNMGSLVILNSNLTNVDVDLNLGSVELVESKIKDAKITCNMGSIEAKNSVIENANIETDMGAVELSGTLLGDNEFSSNMGSITLKLNQKRETLGISTKVDMGSIEINGVETSLQDDKSKYTNYLKTNTDMGSIEIDFKE